MVSILAWVLLIVDLFVTVISSYGVLVGTAALYNVFIGVACIIIGAVLAYLKIPKEQPLYSGTSVNKGTLVYKTGEST